MSDTPINAAPQNAEELQELAKSALKARMAAPYSSGTRTDRIPQKEILARLNADQGGLNDVKGGMHRLFVPQSDVRGYAYHGYAPCMEGGKPAVFMSDIAVEIPTEVYERELEDNARLDAAQQRKHMKEVESIGKETGIGDEVEVPDSKPAVRTKVK